MSTILIKNKLHKAFEAFNFSVRNRYPNGLFKNSAKEDELDEGIEELENWTDSRLGVEDGSINLVII